MEHIQSRPTALGCGCSAAVGYLIMLFNPSLGNSILPLSLASTFMGNFFLWTLLTASFVENNIFRLLFDIIVLLAFSNCVEEVHDQLRMALYLIFVAVGSGVATAISVFVGFVITRWENLLFSSTFGMGGVLMALFMVLKQKMPCEPVLAALPQFRYLHLPFTWLVGAVLVRVIGGVMLTKDVPLICWSFVISWFYLRFLQQNPDGSVGNISEDFALVTLFPQVTHKYLAPIFNFCYGVSILCGFFKEREMAMAANLSPEVSPVRPMVMLTESRKDPIAERRKAKAMKVLDAKLASLARESSQKWAEHEAGRPEVVRPALSEATGDQ